jgi:hypothetical protein
LDKLCRFLIFILAAILKILKTEHNFETTLSDDLFLCQVSKGSAVWSEFNIFLHLGYHGNGRHFEFFQPLKSCQIQNDCQNTKILRFGQKLGSNYFLLCSHTILNLFILEFLTIFLIFILATILKTKPAQL